MGLQTISHVLAHQHSKSIVQNAILTAIALHAEDETATATIPLEVLAAYGHTSTEGATKALKALIERKDLEQHGQTFTIPTTDCSCTPGATHTPANLDVEMPPLPHPVPLEKEPASQAEPITVNLTINPATGNVEAHLLRTDVWGKKISLPAEVPAPQRKQTPVESPEPVEQPELEEEQGDTIDELTPTEPSEVLSIAPEKPRAPAEYLQAPRNGTWKPGTTFVGKTKAAVAAICTDGWKYVAEGRRKPANLESRMSRKAGSFINATTDEAAAQNIIHAAGRAAAVTLEYVKHSEHKTGLSPTDSATVTNAERGFELLVNGAPYKMVCLAMRAAGDNGGFVDVYFDRIARNGENAVNIPAWKMTDTNAELGRIGAYAAAYQDYTGTNNEPVGTQQPAITSDADSDVIEAEVIDADAQGAFFPAEEPQYPQSYGDWEKF